ncbi:MAG TPA: HAD-IA family hydrolase [candidate division Zixibacteria bacterium]|nr:HAD-IA family hydrolase [candidate division Zixibacteria bacterium]
MTTLRAVFLDIGETVMRPNPSWEHIYAIAFEEHGVKVDLERLRDALRAAYHHGGWGFRDGFEPNEETSYQRTVEVDRAAITELGIGPMPDSFFRRLNELFMVVSNWHVFPDALPTIRALRRRGLIVGAVSNWVWQLPELLHSLELVSHFDFVAASARVGYEKPHPEIFRYALRQAGVQPHEALHVGDHLDADVAGARNVGIEAVLIDRRERFSPEDLPDGVPLVRSLRELLPIVDARVQRASA